MPRMSRRRPRRSRRERWASLLAAGLVLAVGLLHVVRPLDPLRRLESAVEDARLYGHPDDEPAGRRHDVVIVDVDESSLQRIGHWPWPRARLARLTQRLFDDYGAGAVGYDFVFPEPDDGGWSTLAPVIDGDARWSAQSGALRAQLDQDAAFARALADRPVALGTYFTADRGGHRQGLLPRPLWPRADDALPGDSRGPGGPPDAAGRSFALPAWSGYAGNVPALAGAAPAGGFFNVLVDSDGLVRRLPLVASYEGRLYPSLLLAVLALDGRMSTLEPRVVDMADGRLAVSALAWTDPSGRRTRLQLDEGGAVRVPFAGRVGLSGGRFLYVSAADVIDGTVQGDPLRGRIVLVGSSAPGLGDLRATPVHPSLPGVEVHAHLMAGLLDGNVLQRPSWAPGYEAASMLLLIAAAAWSGRRRSAPWALVSFGVVALVAVVANVVAWRTEGLLLPIAAPLLLAAMLFGSQLAANYVRLWGDRRTLMRLFGTYLPPDRVREIASSDQAVIDQAENRELTVMFCDLRGFTSITERLAPLALRDLLNDYFSTASAIVHHHGGTVDKFIGDAVMAFWGAPLPMADHARRGVAAALELLDAVNPLNERLRAQGLPEVSVGVGVSTGVVCVGDLGSAQRRAYTAVGDAVNIAARLESLTKEVGVPLLVDGATRDAAAATAGADRASVAWLEVDTLPVRGRTRPVTVVTPLSPMALQDPDLREYLQAWHLARAAVQADDLAAARQYLEHLDQQLHMPADPVETPASAGSAVVDDHAVALRRARAMLATLTRRRLSHLRGTEPRA